MVRVYPIGEQHLGKDLKDVRGIISMTNSRKCVPGKGTASAEAQVWDHAWLAQVTTRSLVWLEQRKG